MKWLKLSMIVFFSLLFLLGNACCGGRSTSMPTSTPNTALEASLSLEFSDFVYEYSQGAHLYYHTRTFTESNGVGVTLTESQGCVCYRANKYKEDCSIPMDYINYRIEANSQLVIYDKYIGTNSDDLQIFIRKYWGIDDNGHPVYVEQSVSVCGPDIFYE